MTSLLKMSEDELAKQEDGFVFRRTVLLAGAASLLSLGGMVLRYAEGDTVPLEGMDSFHGQVRIALTLGASMIAAAWLIRGVIMQRLQWAVVVSLLIHLLACLALRRVVLDVPIAPFVAMDAEEISVPELALPDYGGAESAASESQQWERPSNVEAEESEQHELDRQTAEITPDAEPEEVEVERAVESAAVPNRRQQQEQMDAAMQLELQHRRQQAQIEAMEQLEAPPVETTEAQQPQLDPRQMDRVEANPQNSAREMERVDAQRENSIASASLQASDQMIPRELNSVSVAQQERSSVSVAAADASAEVVEIAETADVSRNVTESRPVETARQTNVALPSRQNSAVQAASGGSLQVRRMVPARSAASALASLPAPSGGGAAAMSRSTSSATLSPGAVASAAPTVTVNSASGAAAPSLSASSNAGVSRTSSVAPVGAAGREGAVSAQTSRSGVATLQTGTLGSGRGSQTGPTLGTAVGGNSGVAATRARAGNVPGAVGTQAEQVAVGSVGASRAGSDGGLGAGPASGTTGVSRSGTGLPSPTSSGMAPGASPNGVASGRRSVALNAIGRSGLSGRSSDSTARLRGTIRGLGQRTGRSSSRSVGISLPDGALRAEESGALVIAGPQAPAAGGGSASRNQGTSGMRIARDGSLTGPTGLSSGRRSAGLPGVNRGPSTIARSRPSLPGVRGISPVGRTGGRESRPRLTTASDVAGLVRRNVPGISDLQTDRVGAAFSMRTPEARREAVLELGGNEQSEAAVERGLEWLAAHQYAAGNWSIHQMNCAGHNCTGRGTYEADPAATGLALLAFLGAGNTHQSGTYREEVRRGLNWLTGNQKEDGDLFPVPSEFAHFYSHGIAAIALCEAYGMTKDPELRDPAQRAIQFIIQSQHPKFGGWRYEPQFESDTSVSGWQLMALKSGQMAGLKIPASAYKGVETWLASVENKDAPGRFRYHPSTEVTETMTAEGLLMRQYLGADRTDSAVQAGASYLRQRLPRSDVRNSYYWYYATQVMFHLQGEHWQEWNAALRELLVQTQEKGGPARGSWDPAAPVKDTWGQSGGRHYVTCLNLLMLEVYYRHLPLYIDLAP